jgi:hypothetical protein
MFQGGPETIDRIANSRDEVAETAALEIGGFAGISHAAG